jgi:cation diffusion facilitator family transporter
MVTPRSALAISVSAAAIVIALKWGAWWTTGSVGFLSDAMHSLVNLAAASFALIMVFVARRPPNREYPFGFGKAEYFSAAFEGGLICAAAVAIIYAVIERILHPEPLQPLGLGSALSACGALINFAVAQMLIRVGRLQRSPATEGDGRHLMADVWITTGVIAGVAIAGATHWSWPDNAAGLLVAANLARVGRKLIATSLSGLLDAAWPEADVRRLEDALRAHESEGASFRNVRTRRGGAHRFASAELWVPPGASITRADSIASAAEQAVRQYDIVLLVRIKPNGSASNAHS